MKRHNVILNERGLIMKKYILAFLILGMAAFLITGCGDRTKTILEAVQEKENSY